MFSQACVCSGGGARVSLVPGPLREGGAGYPWYQVPAGE